MSKESNIKAVLDLGTNTFNLVMARQQGNSSHIFYKDRIAVKIGKSGINQGLITPEAENRALDALITLKKVLDDYGVLPEHTTAIATSAFRNASNGTELARKIRVNTGIEVHIISGDDEALLIYQGVRAALNIGQKPTLVMDVGGGSVEFIICTHDSLLWKQSFEVGAQRLFELFHRADPIEEEMLAAMNDYLQQKLEPLYNACRLHKPRTLIGSSGAFDTFCEIEYLRTGLSLRLFKHTELQLSVEGFLGIDEELKHKNVSERRAVPGMSEMRVDMIVVAGELIKHVLHHAKINKMRVSAYSLKEGALLGHPAGLKTPAA